jgi:lipid II:glycine glycyltransferase (peptidoglycan interpeptide bridge formation enzyme)
MRKASQEEKDEKQEDIDSLSGPIAVVSEKALPEENVVINIILHPTTLATTVCYWWSSTEDSYNEHKAPLLYEQWQCMKSAIQTFDLTQCTLPPSGLIPLAFDS